LAERTVALKEKSQRRCQKNLINCFHLILTISFSGFFIVSSTSTLVVPQS
jgi:hypothetical protein